MRNESIRVKPKTYLPLHSPKGWQPSLSQTIGNAATLEVVQRLTVDNMSSTDNPQYVKDRIQYWIDRVFNEICIKNRLNSMPDPELPTELVNVLLDEKFLNEINLILQDTELRDIITCLMQEPRIRTDINLQQIKTAFTAKADYVMQTNKRMQCLSSQLEIPVDSLFGMIRDASFSIPYLLEDEPNYTSSMAKALKLALKPAPPMDSKSYRKFHQTAMAHLGLSGDYRNIASEKGVMFGLIPGNNMTPAGLREFHEKSFLAQNIQVAEDKRSQLPSKKKLQKKVAPQDRQKWIVGTYCGVIEERNWFGGAFLPAKRKACKDPGSRAAILADMIFENYYERLMACQEQGEKIALIAETCQTLDQLHLFFDGNVRTVYLLLNHLLQEAGLSPALLDNPNIFDMYSINELVAAIEEGRSKMAGKPQ